MADTTTILDEPRSVSPNTVASFQNKGHTLIKQVIDRKSALQFGHIIRRAANAYNTETRALEERDTYGKAFLQIMNLWEVDPEVRRFTLARRFASVAAQLLGAKHVRIYHDQALFKEPGGGFTPWHQDQYYWPLDTAQTITMWMPMIDISEDMGMLTFASGSHKGAMVENMAISDESESVLEQHVAKHAFPIERAKSMQAGDATFHYGWTLHTAPGNLSEITREVMTLIYYADGAHITQPINEFQENDRQRWLSGLAVGSKADSELNPLVF